MLYLTRQEVKPLVDLRFYDDEIVAGICKRDDALQYVEAVEAERNHNLRSVEVGSFHSD